MVFLSLGPVGFLHLLVVSFPSSDFLYGVDNENRDYIFNKYSTAFILQFEVQRQWAKTKKTMGDRAFQVTAPFLWNKLPRSAREATSLESLKTLIKTFLFKESFQLSYYIYIYICNYRLLILLTYVYDF